MSIDDFLAKLEGVTSDGKGGWMACCPAHDDHNPSMHVNVGADGRILVKCYAGCTTADIVAAMGLKTRDLMPERSTPGRAGESGRGKDRIRTGGKYDNGNAKGMGEQRRNHVRGRGRFLKTGSGRLRFVTRRIAGSSRRPATSPMMYRVEAVLKAIEAGEGMPNDGIIERDANGAAVYGTNQAKGAAA